MRPPARRVLWALMAAPAAAVAWSAGGCTSPPPSQSATPDAQAVCPNTLADTIGAPCTVDGLVCSPQYACGAAYGLARCVCTSGSFACTDLADAALEAQDATPSCPAPTAPEKCPTTEAAARLAPCTESGLVCSYIPQCAGATGLDQCQCVFGALPSGQSGLRLQCNSPCRYSPPPVDIDAALGASDSSIRDAPADSASSTDAALPDGPGDARDE
jgi:hypothetical protein